MILLRVASWEGGSEGGREGGICETVGKISKIADLLCH